MPTGMKDAPTPDRTVIDLPLEVKAEGEPGSFEGYGAIFGNIDRDGDIVSKGAFADSLKARLPALLWQHNPKEPIGRFDVVREDEKGLFVKGRLSQSGKGREAYELLKMGALNGLSIGFVTKEAQRDRGKGTRTITRADLMEVSLVTFPANELARIETVKQQGPAGTAEELNTPRAFERMLRSAGFSRSRAKAITSKGFAAGKKNVIGHEVAQLVADVRGRQHAIEGKRETSGMAAIMRLFEFARTPINRVSVFPGDTKTLLIAPVRLGRVTFTIDPPDWTYFKCVIKYYDFNSGRPLRGEETLYRNRETERLSVTVDRGRPPTFNPLSLADWKRQFPEQLVLDSTRAVLTHYKHPEAAIRDLPQPRGHFTIGVR